MSWTCSTDGVLNRAGLTDESTQLLTLAAADGYVPYILHADFNKSTPCAVGNSENQCESL